MSPPAARRVYALAGAESLANVLVSRLGARRGTMTMHVFPDGESCPRVDGDVRGCDGGIAAGLDRPDSKLVPLFLLATSLREQGAARVMLAAPYLPYMRQDRPFRSGEGTSARHIADWLSSFIDGLVTVDPHLHRIHRLEEVYSVPSRVVAAAPAIARWIAAAVDEPLLIGPDGESEQWVADVAARVGCPHTVLRKLRRGDHDVEVSLPEAAPARGRTPVLVDDIVSTARTMIAAVKQLQTLDLPPALCVGVHAIFAGDAYAALQDAGVADVATCNTVPHPSNAIDVHEGIADAIGELLDGR